MESQGKTIDVSSLLRKMYDKAEELQTIKTPLSRYFSADGKFFSSSLSKTLRSSLKEMGIRSLRSKFEQSTIDKLVSMARTKGSPHYISETADELDVAMYYTEKDELKAFQALPSEVMDLQAAFSSYAYKTKNPEIAAEF